MCALMRESGGNFYLRRLIPIYTKDIWALENFLKKSHISMFWVVLKCSISKSSSLVTEWLTTNVTYNFNCYNPFCFCFRRENLSSSSVLFILLTNSFSPTWHGVSNSKLNILIRSVYLTRLRTNSGSFPFFHDNRRDPKYLVLSER